MAEEKKESASLAKPAEFFIGLVDFFAILLPGGLATALLLEFASTSCIWGAILSQSIAQYIPKDQHWPYWVAFAVVSYLLGHFIFLIGSASLDRLYDSTYRQMKRDEDQALQARAKTLLKTAPILLDPAEIDSILQWSAIFARLRCPGTAIEIDRLEADSKFFRSLTVLLVLSGYMVPAVLYPGKTRWIASLSLVLLLFVGVSIVGGWRGLDERIRHKAYMLYERRLKEPDKQPNATDIDDWALAEKKIKRFMKLCAWAVIGLAVLAQIPLCYKTDNLWVGLQIASAVGLALSGWRFMERRFRRTVFTYRLFIASSTAQNPQVGI